MTDNHNYVEPEIGSTTGWGESLNSNFRDLDTDVEIRDVDANKGDYTPKDGAKFKATDTGAVYIGDGTDWNLADIEVKGATVESLNVSSWEWIDVVDAGLANDGSEDAATFISNNAASNTMLQFPPGTYAFDNKVTVENVENFGLIAPTGGVTFQEGAIGSNSTMIQLGTSTNPARNLLLKGVDTDASAAGFLEVVGEALVEDIEFTAEKTVDDTTFHIDVRVLDEARSTTFRNVRMPQGGAATGSSSEPGGFYVFQEHAGTINFIDCMTGGFPNNALYASAPGEDAGADGRVHIEGGVFKNSNISNLRIGGDGSSIRGATIIFDNLKTDFTNLRGIYLRNGDGHLVENNKILAKSGLSSPGSHVGIYHLADGGTTTYRDNFIRTDSSIRAIRTFATGGSTKPITFDGLTFVGDADTSGQSYAIYIDGRDEVTFKNAHIVQPNRDGLWINGPNFHFADSHYDAGDLLVQGDDYSEENVTNLGTASYDGARDVIDGWGENDGDPNSTGEWNGAGYEGAAVVDTTNNVKYVYRGGAWV